MCRWIFEAWRTVQSICLVASPSAHHTLERLNTNSAIPSLMHKRTATTIRGLNKTKIQKAIKMEPAKSPSWLRYRGLFALRTASTCVREKGKPATACRVLSYLSAATNEGSPANLPFSLSFSSLRFSNCAVRSVRARSINNCTRGESTWLSVARVSVGGCISLAGSCLCWSVSRGWSACGWCSSNSR